MQHDNKTTRNVADAALKIMMGEEPDNQQFTQEVDKAKTKASEKKSPKDEARVAAGKIQASVNVPVSGTVKEELKGGQKNIDMNKNGKVDAEDFKMLRKKKSAKRVVHSDRPDSLVSMKVSKEEVEELEEGKLKDMVTGHMDAGHSFDKAMEKAQADLSKMKPAAAAADKKVQKDNLKKTMGKSMQKEASKPSPAMADAFAKLRAGGSRIQDGPSNVTKTSTGLIHKAKLAKGPKYGVTDFTKNVEDSEAEGPKGSKRKSYGARQNKVRSTRVSGKDVNEQQIDEGPIGATLGATGGAMMAGPVGAAVGGVVGHKLEKGARSLGKRFKAAKDAFKRKPVNPENKEEYKPSFTDMLESYQERGLDYIKQINEDVELLDEKNKPTNPALWARAKAAAKSKFDVYPSAYANGWAAKWYKKRGGSWKSVKEEVEQLDELSPKTLGSYAKKAQRQTMNTNMAIGANPVNNIFTRQEKGFAKKRKEGASRAIGKLVQKKMSKEEYEQLDELSPKTLGSYSQKSVRDLEKRDRAMGKAMQRDSEVVLPDRSKPFQKMAKRRSGLAKAINRLSKEELEYVETVIDQLEEGTPTKKQVKQGIGIARDKRYAKGNMSGAVNAMDKVNKGIAQHPAVAKELRKQNESSNFKDLRHQLDELKTPTLKRYIDKAEDSQVDAGMDKKMNTPKYRRRDLSIAKAKGRLSMNRQLGRAEESVQEAKMTDGQMDKREKIVMAMKPKMQGFKDRYGDDAKSVMYATATKQAMKEEIEEYDYIFESEYLKLSEEEQRLWEKVDADSYYRLKDKKRDIPAAKFGERGTKTKVLKQIDRAAGSVNTRLGDFGSNYSEKGRKSDYATDFKVGKKDKKEMIYRKKSGKTGQIPSQRAEVRRDKSYDF